MRYLCQKNPYLKQLTTKVISCVPYVEGGSKQTTEKSFIVELEESPFFPEGGGQPADTGKIGEAKVLWVMREPGRILHQVDVCLDVGAEVECLLDWPRRYDHMQQHSGQHLLSAVLDHYDISTLSWELGRTTCNIDVKVDKNKFDSQFLVKIENQVNEKIRQALPVISHEYDVNELDLLVEQGKLRTRPSITNGFTSLSFIEIKDTDLNMCCGTHVNSLSELQAIKLLFTEPMKGNLRLHFISGQRVLDRLSSLLLYEKDMTKILKCNFKEHSSKIECCIKSAKLLEKSNCNLLREIAKNDAITIGNDSKKFVFVHKEDYGSVYLNSLMKELNEDVNVENDKIVMAVCGPLKGPGVFAVKGSQLFFTNNEQMILKALEAKGKSRNGILQGKAENLTAVSTLVECFDKQMTV